MISLASVFEQPPKVWESPDTTTEVPWIIVHSHLFDREKIKHSDMGKWLIFTTRDQINQVWDLIRFNTESGKLGPCSKVSTYNPSRPDAHHVICVYSYGVDPDIFRICEELRILGFTGKLPYKTDRASRDRICSDIPIGRVSKYYC